MKAVWIQEPCKIEVTEVEKPDIRRDEALLRILYCGICGADVASYTAISRLLHIREFRARI